MSKLFLSIVLLSSFLYAKDSAEVVEDFLQETIGTNPNIKNLDVNVVDTVEVKQLKGWSAYIVDISAIIKRDNKKIKQKMIWFSNGVVITKELTMMNSNDNLSDLVKPKLKKDDYKAENLVSGSEKSKHKVALFSDPLCPFCRKFVPNAIEYMKKQPDKFAVYYYNFPLPSIHPASMTLVAAEVAAELQGHKNVLLDLYKVKVNPREKDQQKILDAFNKATGLNISIKDIKDSKVKARLDQDLNIANNVMVQGTPTIFFDGQNDRTKEKYKKVK